MKIVCVGGGPAGLYFAILMKLRDNDHEVTVLERNPADVTYGWGVTLPESLLAQLDDNDPPTARAIRDNAVSWVGTVAHIGDERAVHPTDSGFSIGRHRLLDILSTRARDLGVHIRYEHEFEDFSELSQADLVVACDGVNSRLRQLHPERFRTSVVPGRNKYVWLGTTKVFDAFTYSYVETHAGWIWFHAYKFGHDISTFIVECPEDTWRGLGLDTLSEEQSTALLQEIFAPQLDGHPLINQARGKGAMEWLNFRNVINAKWHHENIVLMGDAAHTTHFTIGAGTRLALEDAIALAEKMGETRNDVRSALEAYEKERKLALLSSRLAARNSARWHEHISRYVRFEPHVFFLLLRQRRSLLLPYVPPLAYYRFQRAIQGTVVLQERRRTLRCRARALFVRAYSAVIGNRPCELPRSAG